MTTPAKDHEVQFRMTLPEVAGVNGSDPLIAQFTLRNGSESLITFSAMSREHQETLIRVWDASQMRVPTSPGASYYMRPETGYDTSAELLRIEPGQVLSWEKDVSKCYTLSEGEYTVQALVDVFTYEDPQPLSRTISSNVARLKITATPVR